MSCDSLPTEKLGRIRIRNFMRSRIRIRKKKIIWSITLLYCFKSINTGRICNSPVHHRVDLFHGEQVTSHGKNQPGSLSNFNQWYGITQPSASAVSHLKDWTNRSALTLFSRQLSQVLVHCWYSDTCLVRWSVSSSRNKGTNICTIFQCHTVKNSMVGRVGKYRYLITHLKRKVAIRPWIIFKNTNRRTQIR